jgi:hypothetical protein
MRKAFEIKWFTLAATLAIACAPSANPRGADTSAGTYRVDWTTSPDPIPFSELFEVTVSVTAAGAPAADSSLALAVVMPAHGHGMQTAPELTSTGPGTFRIRGMKFHMRGLWRLTFSVDGPRGPDTAVFDEIFE